MLVLRALVQPTGVALAHDAVAPGTGDPRTYEHPVMLTLAAVEFDHIDNVRRTSPRVRCRGTMDSMEGE